MKKCPKWEDIDHTARSLIEKRFFDENDHQKLFNCYDYLKQYCDEDKLNSWTQNKSTTEQRWVEFFTHMNENFDCDPLIQLVSYALAIPGTRIFLIYIILLHLFSLTWQSLFELFQEQMQQPSALFLW